MKVFLVIYILVGSTWITGSTFDGWHPREQVSLEICEERAMDINGMNNSVKAECHIEEIEKDKE